MPARLHSALLHAAAGKIPRMRRPSPTELYAFVIATSLVLEAGTVAFAGVGTRLDPKSAQGAIGGRIQYPQGVAPDMRICAITGVAQRCIDSPAGRTLYRIGELPDGDYQVVARVSDPALPVAGHMQEVQCIRAPCPARLATLAIAGGREVASADLNGFYAERADFPVLED